MTDLVLDASNDLSVVDGQLLTLATVQDLTRQRLVFQLRSFTNTLFTNIDFGIDADLIFDKNTRDLLDQNIKGIISDTKGITSLLEFKSFVDNTTREYYTNFTYSLETGEIEVIEQLGFSGAALLVTKGIWRDGKWNYAGIWDSKDVWGKST